MSRPNFHFTHCGSCGCDAGTATNPATGTLFYCCSAFERTGCRWTASPVTGKQWGLASVVARASSKRSRATSLRADTRARLIGKGHTPEAADELIARLGVLEASEQAA